MWPDTLARITRALLASALAASTAVLVFSEPVSAKADSLKDDNHSISAYYEHHREGWFWYEAIPEEPPPEKAAEQTPPQASEPAPTKEAPAPLSAAWLKINLPKYLDRATDEPTRENIAAYYYLQKVAVDKSNKFADVAQEVATEDFNLDEVSRRPLATYAINEVNKLAGRAHDDLLRQISAKAGIVFVYHSECQYCLIQAPVLSRFAQQYGFAVTAISLDGRPMPDGSFPNFITDNGQARTLGVQQTPSLFLAVPPDKAVELAQGVLSVDELSQRVAMAAKQLGVIDDSDFDRARPLRPVPVTADLRPDRDTAADPNSLVDYLRNALRLRH